MDAESRQRDAVTRLIGRLRDGAAAIARDVAADLGTDVTPDTAEPVVQRFLAAISGGSMRVGEADLVRLRTEGAAAARQGQPLAAPIDAYLSTAWVSWDHALRVARDGEPEVLGALGATLLRAGDDIAAALADGYTAAERALASTAGATRQAILDELLTPGNLDPAAAARMVRRVAIVGFDPGSTYHLLLIRSAGEPERSGELVEDLSRRLARDPARRPSLVAVRGADVVAIGAPAVRDGVPFGDLVGDVSPTGPWWAVVSEAVSIDGMSAAYADAIDALRVVPIVVPPGRVTRIGDVALERAIVADPTLAGLGATHWLGPVERAGRGGPEVIRTLQAWLASGESVVATARALRVAPRTVSYRLARVASLLSVPALDADVRARLSTALLVRRLLGPTPDALAPAGSDTPTGSDTRAQTEGAQDGVRRPGRVASSR